MPSLSNALATILHHRSLILRLAKREVENKYKGSIMGLAWLVLYPIFMLSIYTLVFGSIFQARWGDDGDTYQFALNLYIGLLLYNFFSECIGRSPNQILEQVSYVKKVVFPLEILSVTTAASAFFNLLIGLVLWMIFSTWHSGELQLSLLLTPFVLFGLVLGTIGLSWMLSALGVYFRDIHQFVTITLQALLFLSPVFYPRSRIPESFQGIFDLNPLTIPIESMRSLAHGSDHVLDHTLVLGIYTALGVAVFILGLTVFRHLSKGFADVV